MNDKKHVLIVFTGGTISMKKTMESGKIEVSNTHSALLTEVETHLKNIELSFCELFNKPSPSIKMDDLFTLAKHINSELEKDIYDGIVLTHGTDVLEETAYFLDLYLNTETPIVMTGSMRSYSDLGFDGFNNLLSSILVASSDESKNRGVLVVLNDEINSASEVTKSHTLALDTFKSLDFGPIGIIDDENVIYYRRVLRNRNGLQPKSLISNVQVIPTFIGQSLDLVNLLIDSGVKGLIVEGLGRGNIPPTLVPGIVRAIENDIPVVLVSRCPKGRVLDTYDYEGGGHHLKKLGVLFAHNLNAQKARIKLILALSTEKDIKKVKSHFD